MEGTDASQVLPDEQVSVVFTTKLTNEEYILDEDSTGPFILPALSTRTELCSLLSQLLNLSAEQSNSFDFIVNDSPLRLSLKQHLDATQHTSENQISIEYFIAWKPSQPELVVKSPSAVLQLQKLAKTEKILSLCTRGNLCWKGFGGDVDMQQNTMKLESDISTYMYYKSENCDEADDFLVFTNAGTIYKVNLAERTSYRVAKLSQKDSPSIVAVNNNSNCFATASINGSISIYDTKIQEAFLEVPKVQNKRSLESQQLKVKTVEPICARQDVHSSEITGLEWINLADGSNLLISGGIDGFVRILSSQNGVTVGEFNAKDAISSIIARKRENNDRENNGDNTVGFQIVTGHTSGLVRVWNGVLQLNSSSNKEPTPHYRLHQIELTGSFPAHNKFVTTCCWNPFNLDVIATAANDQMVSVIDMRTRQIPLSLTIIPDSTKICPELDQREYTTVPTALLWWDERVLLVGTSQNTILRYTY